ncbi:MAG: hypothetical protein J6Z43_10815 [Clostridiales bacterium]|nr:hypothetical protein [Clostridiales bacterium]
MSKKPASKGAKIIFIVLFVLTFIFRTALIVIAVMLWKPVYSLYYIDTDTGYNLVDTSLTTEQKLSDLEYMYNIVCLGNPNKALYEEAYGISYEDVYSQYRDLVAGSESEYEFFSYMSCFLAILPGQHNYMKLQDYDRTAVNGSFSLTEIYGNQEQKDYAYSWKEAWRDDVAAYNDCNLIGFYYVDGKYIGMSASTSAVRTNVCDYLNAQLISIDGRDPVDLCFEMPNRYVPDYDGINQCFFRENLLFNDGVGQPHTAVIRLADGTVETREIYDDPGFAIAFAEATSVYPELFEDRPEETEDTDEPKTYRITTDAGRKMVYINSVMCNTDEGERLAADLRQAIQEVDAETVILDIRSNTGGVSSFCNEQLLPVIFSHDLEFRSRVCGLKNEHTKNFYNSLFNRLFALFVGDSDFNCDKEHFYYTEDFSVEGQADHDYKIYVLTSHKTFSSGDILARLCKAYDNAVVIGTNTGGEGICGSPFNCSLPESHFMFTYTPTYCVDAPDDDVYGTAPDIYIPYTAEEYMARQEIIARGESANSYESRLTWDQTLLQVLDMIDKGE